MLCRIPKNTNFSSIVHDVHASNRHQTHGNVRLVNVTYGSSPSIVSLSAYLSQLPSNSHFKNRDIDEPNKSALAAKLVQREKSQENDGNPS